MKIAKLFFKTHIRPNLRSNFGNHMILWISEFIGSRDGGIEILTMMGVQKCHFLAKSENLTNACFYCSSKLIVKNKCLVYKDRLDFPLIFHITKIVRFHISRI